MDVLNKKMKGASVGFDQFVAVDDGAEAKLKYQTLLNEYLDLQKECVSRKRKLQAANHKRDAILAQVRFLRRRHKHLSRNQDPNRDKDPPHLPNSEMDINVPRIQDFGQVLVPNSLKYEKIDGIEHCRENKLFTRKLKNALACDDKGVLGKTEICWPGQVRVKLAHCTVQSF